MKKIRLFHREFDLNSPQRDRSIQRKGRKPILVSILCDKDEEKDKG